MTRYVSTLWLLLPLMLPAQTEKLRILSPGFQQFEDGPNLPGKASFTGGETIFFRCQVTGYKVSAKEAMGLDWKAEVFDDANVAVAKPEAKSLTADVAPEDKEWKPIIRFQFEAPHTAQCQNCRLVLRVQDKLTGEVATAEIGFSISSKAVEPSETLVVRNFRFLRSEEDGPPLPVAAYRAGDELWARFEITGYRFGEGNRSDVEYGLAVYRPSGKLLFEEPKAAHAEEKSFYPKRYVPGTLNLRLQGLPPGEYPIVLHVRDLIGDQKYEARFPFRVE